VPTAAEDATFVRRTEWLFIEASAKTAVDINEAFGDVVVPHHRYALAMAQGQAQGWCWCGGVPARHN
jgi:uncharacterized protein (DUF305 family)